MAIPSIPSAHDLVRLHRPSSDERTSEMLAHLMKIGGWPSYRFARLTCGRFFCREFPETAVEMVARAARRATDRQIVRDALACVALNAPAASTRLLFGPGELHLPIRADLVVRCQYHFAFRGDGPPTWVFFQPRIGGRPSDPELAMLLGLLREALISDHPGAAVAVLDVGGNRSDARLYRFLTERELGSVTTDEVGTFLDEMAHSYDDAVRSGDWAEYEARKAALNAARAEQRGRDKPAKGWFDDDT